ncbi:LPS assembly protein LptD [Cardiobacteriaceae bacterium TAE3-ERU3]|nr:LPS assembly protein LptD [Cardiobacteriaceae bacterium TAE3-ERU3]
MTILHRGWVSLLLVPLTASGVQCPVDQLDRYTTLGGDPQNERVDVEADNSEANYGSAIFTGSVEMRQGDKHLFSPKLTYQRENESVQTEGSTIFANGEVAVTGADADYDLTQRFVSIREAQYYLKSGNLAAVGKAKLAKFDLDNDVSTFADPTWSTCPRNDQVWSLKAGTLSIDRKVGRAVAHNATLRIKNVPVFYVPYFSFPIDSRRASGFLTPSARLSEGSGLELDIPYYWNIAPNQDATFNLRPMTKRGFMFGSEYRYLGERQSAVLSGAFLPHDKNAENANRWSWRADYNYRFNDQWQANILLQEVSDLNYIEDFSNTLSIYDQWYLERNASLVGNTGYGNLMLRVQDYERVSNNVTGSDVPYARKPQLLYNKNWLQDGWRYGVTAESVRFDKREAVDGWRNSIDAEASYRVSRDYGYFEPKISVNMAHYSFDHTNAAYPENSFTRALPTLSLDGQLEFERSFEMLDKSWRQTLEPRLFYLYTPYKDQSSVPNFDSSLRSQSWDWLFARNRFVGGDRIGDANQLTTAITTRFFDNEDGQEKLHLSLGQVQYFADRRVALPGKTVRNRGRSDLIIDAAYQVDSHWNIRGLSFWDMDERQNRRSIVDIRYNLDTDRFAGFSHRYEENDYDQLSLYALWRFNSRWRAFLRQDYSLRHDRSINSLAGIEYNDCCWAWRLLGKRYRDDPTEPNLRNALYLEFVLKGLGRIGNGSGSVLINEISGYRPLAEDRSF